jgi:DNA-binding LytR/AlgR family response regulator
MNIRCIAVDDEPLAIEKIKSFIDKLPQFQLVATFSNALTAYEFLINNSVDLIFLDIQMGKSNGIELVEKMINKPQIIFTTAYNEYAIKAFELAVTDYLLKPYTFDRFNQAVNKASDYILWQKTVLKSVTKDIDYIFVKSGYKLIKIFLTDILFIEGMRDFQCVVTPDSKILVSHSFQELEKILPKSFVRCHKSYIVSLSRVESIERDRIRIGNKYIPIGDTFKESFYKSL